MGKIDINEKLTLPAREIEIPYVDYTGRTLVGMRESNGLVYISGTGCEHPHDGHAVWKGLIGKDVSPEEGYKAAQWCAMLQLNIMRQAYGLDRVDSVVRAFGLMAVADDFYDLDKVFDGYSDVMYGTFGDRGRHTRSLMGTRNLPNNIVTIEIETIFKLKD